MPNLGFGSSTFPSFHFLQFFRNIFPNQPCIVPFSPLNARVDPCHGFVIASRSLPILEKRIRKRKGSGSLLSFSQEQSWCGGTAIVASAATLGQLAGLIKICGFLMQTKAYLFWKENRE